MVYTYVSMRAYLFCWTYSRILKYEERVENEFFCFFFLFLHEVFCIYYTRHKIFTENVSNTRPGEQKNIRGYLKSFKRWISGRNPLLRSYYDEIRSELKSSKNYRRGSFPLSKKKSSLFLFIFLWETTPFRLRFPLRITTRDRRGKQYLHREMSFEKAQKVKRFLWHKYLYCFLLVPLFKEGS